MGCFQPGTRRGTLDTTIGSRNTVPARACQRSTHANPREPSGNSRRPGRAQSLDVHGVGSGWPGAPLRMLRMVPFGLRHICFRLNSFTRASSGVMVAHCAGRGASRPRLLPAQTRRAAHAGTRASPSVQARLDAHAIFLRAHTRASAACLPSQPGARPSGPRAVRGQPAARGQAADLYRLRGVHGDLVVCGVAVLDSQVKVLDVQVQVGQDELRAGPPLNCVPDFHSRHATTCTLWRAS